MRVFNPTIEEHGWQSTHTIVEIVNDDMPFLVDSVTMEVNRHGLTLHLIIHPIVAVTRDADGTLTASPTRNAGSRSANRSSTSRSIAYWIESKREALAADIARVLDDVRAAVDDWKPMRERVQAISPKTRQRPPPLPADELAEGRAFLPWLADNHFTFLGYRCHDLVKIDGEDALQIVPGTSLGILRESAGKEVAASFAALPPEVTRLRAAARAPGRHQVDVALDRASSRLSRLHRGQALRRQGRGVRRGSLPRPVHIDRVQRQSGRHTAAAAQDRQRRGACRARRRAATPARR